MKLRVLPRLVLIPALVSLFVFPSAAVAAGVQEAHHGEKNAAERSLEPAAGLGGSLLTEASERIQMVTEQLAEAGHGLLALPVLLGELAFKAKDPETLARWGKMAGKILLVLLTALLIEWLVRRMLSRLRDSIVDRKPEGILPKALFLTLHTVLDLVSIAVFAVTAYGILPFTDPGYETSLIALALVNATVLARTLLALSRLVLAPNLPDLRLVSLGQETIHYLYIWVRRLVDLGVFGYFILEAALLLGIPGGLYVFLMRFLGLTITTMLVILVKQNKEDVAGRLRGDGSGPTEEHEREDAGLDPAIRLRGHRQPSLGAVRRRFADFWHFAATVLIVGLFLTWAMEIEGGLAFLLSGLAMTAVVIILAGLLMRLVHEGVERLFRISEDLKALYPDLEARANRYKPFVSNALKIFIIAPSGSEQAKTAQLRHCTLQKKLRRPFLEKGPASLLCSSVENECLIA